MAMYIVFLIGGFVTSIPPLCGVFSGLLHYFFLVFFGWTTVEVIWLYLKLVKVFGIQSFTSRFVLKAAIPTWSKIQLPYNYYIGILRGKSFHGFLCLLHIMVDNRRHERTIHESIFFM